MHEKNREGSVPDDEAVQCTPSHLLPSYGLTLKHIAEKGIRSHVTMGDTFLTAHSGGSRPTRNPPCRQNVWLQHRLLLYSPVARRLQVVTVGWHFAVIFGPFLASDHE